MRMHIFYFYRNLQRIIFIPYHNIFSRFERHIIEHSSHPLLTLPLRLLPPLLAALPRPPLRLRVRGQEVLLVAGGTLVDLERI